MGQLPETALVAEQERDAKDSRESFDPSSFDNKRRLRHMTKRFLGGQGEKSEANRKYSLAYSHQ